MYLAPTHTLDEDDDNVSLVADEDVQDVCDDLTPTHDPSSPGDRPLIIGEDKFQEDTYVAESLQGLRCTLQDIACSCCLLH
jgi:hypothetical protein